MSGLERKARLLKTTIESLQDDADKSQLRRQSPQAILFY